MTALDRLGRSAAMVAIGALALSACEGSSPVTDPADINRPDVDVTVYDGAACDALPHSVVDRNIPDLEPHSFDTDEYLDADRLPDRFTISSCVWAYDEPMFHLFGVSMGHAEVGVLVHGFADPQQAYGFYEGSRNTIRPDGTVDHGRVYGPVHEIAIGDQGVMQHRSADDDSGVGEAFAYFTAGNTVAMIGLATGSSHPMTGDEAIAVLTDLVAAFGT